MRHSSTVVERCLIEGVPFLGWGNHMECTFAGALSAATQATRHRVSYQTILGVTGLAFRTRWYQGIESRWCPSSPCGEFPVEIEAARKALGWSLVAEVNFEQKLSESMPRVMESIDRGLPVLAYDTQMNMGVIVGYEEGGETVVMHDYSNPDGPVRRKASELVRFALLLGERHRHLGTSDAALEGIRIAIRNWKVAHDPEHDTSRGYWLGWTAYEKWAWDLANASTYSVEEQKSLYFVSWWNFDVTSDTHAFAPLFLRDAKAYFPKPIARRLEETAELYDEANQVVERCYLQHDAFLGPWTGKSFEDWSSPVREREARALIAIRDRENDAIKLLEETLAMIDSSDQHRHARR